MVNNKSKKKSFYVMAFEKAWSLLELILDVLCFNAAIILAFLLIGRYYNQFYFISYWDDLLDFNPERFQFVYAITVPLFILPLFPIHGKKWISLPFERLVEVWKAGFAATAVLTVFVYLLRAHMKSFPASVLIMLPFVSSILMSVWRLIVRYAGMYVDKFHPVTKKAIIVGHLEAGVLERLYICSNPIYNIIGYIEPEIHVSDDGIDTSLEDNIGTNLFGHKALQPLGRVERLDELIRKHAPDEIFVAASQFSSNTILEIIACSEKQGIQLKIIPGLYSIMSNAVSIRLINDLPLMDIGKTRITGWNLFLKRMMDIFLSVLFLPPSLLIIIIASIIIVIDSKGWPIFAQTRVGQNGRHFKAYKLRTMKITSEEGPLLTLEKDWRITKVGRFLRKTSVDELPQIFNVLKGDMSIVGPRAVIPMVVEGFSEWERTSLNVKPGITGLAQVSGRDELGFKDKSTLNVYYIRNYSIAMDVKILFRTVAVVFSQVGTEGTRLTSH